MHLGTVIALCVSVIAVVLSAVEADDVPHPLAPMSHQGFSQRETAGGNRSCPLWFIREKNGSYTCGDSLGSVIMCDSHSVRLLQSCYCMTYTNGAGVVGHCLSGCSLRPKKTLYLPISDTPTVAKLNAMTCGRYNRTGKLCGKCRDGFSVPAYSYEWTCVQCSAKASNWLKYIAVAFLPLTVFFVVVLTFRINVSSAPLHGVVLIAQLLSAPRPVMRVLATKSYTVHGASKYLGFDGLFTVYGIWCLDFFRMVYKPFCLYPNMTMLQTMMLDYLIALYPIGLIMVIYFLAKMYDQNFQPIVWLLKPVQWFMARFRRQFNIRMSLVDAFNTFFILSYMKCIAISFSLLLPNYHFDVYGNRDLYFFYDGSVEYLGSTHMPYALLAFAVLLIYVAFPVVVIVLYQFRCIHRRAVCRHLMGNSLHMFMDAIQGGYKDGTNGTRDCRYFPLVYLLLRALLLVAYIPTLSGSFYVVAALILMAGALAVGIICPYKSTFYNVFDPILRQSLSAFCILLRLCDDITFQQITASVAVAQLLYTLLGIFPAAYMLVYTTYWFIGRTRVAQVCRRLKHMLGRNRGPRELDNSLPHRLTHADEYTPLTLPDEYTPLLGEVRST